MVFSHPILFAYMYFLHCCCIVNLNIQTFIRVLYDVIGVSLSAVLCINKWFTTATACYLIIMPMLRVVAAACGAVS